jgi:hypothetical protein
MAFMFKGPASLTSGSVVDAASVTADNATVDVDLTVGDDLTVTDVLTVKNIIISNSGSLTINGGAEITSVEGTGTALTTKSYVDTPSAQFITSMSGTAYTTFSITSNNVLFYNNVSGNHGVPTITATISMPADPNNLPNGYRVFIAWIRRGGTTATGLKIDFGASNIYDGTASGKRYITLALWASTIITYISDESQGGSIKRWHVAATTGVVTS